MTPKNHANGMPKPTRTPETAMRQTVLRLTEQNAKLLSDNRQFARRIAQLEAENRRLAAERDNAVKEAEMTQAENDVLTLRLHHGLVTLK